MRTPVSGEVGAGPPAAAPATPTDVEIVCAMDRCDHVARDEDFLCDKHRQLVELEVPDRLEKNPTGPIRVLHEYAELEEALRLQVALDAFPAYLAAIEHLAVQQFFEQLPRVYRRHRT